MPIKISTRDDGTPSVVLAGIELADVLATEGVAIRYVDPFARTVGSAVSEPEITLTFAPGALNLDFEVDLLRRLLDDAEMRA
jgi:hypothetical protein